MKRGRRITTVFRRDAKRRKAGGRSGGGVGGVKFLERRCRIFLRATQSRGNSKRPMIFLCFFAWIDVTLLGGPAYNSMLEYRAKVIGRNVSRMVIVQGNLSYSGAKQVALPNHLMKRLKRLVPGGVTLLNVPFPEKVESQWDRERIHRWYTVQWLLANEPDAVAFILSLIHI